MIIKILGNGGAISNGLNYNSFIIDDKILCETPPDIINSLFRENINITDINFIIISHFHADHFFGFPFLILNLFYLNYNSLNKKTYHVFGPEGIKNKSKEILSIGFGVEHPVLKWMEENFNFIEITEDKPFSISHYIFNFYKMNHFILTYGFIVKTEENKMIFSYIADTVWCDNITKILKKLPKHVLIDINGESNDPVKVHLSEDDIKKLACSITGTKTHYWGTHLKENKKSNDAFISYAFPGLIIDTD